MAVTPVDVAGSLKKGLTLKSLQDEALARDQAREKATQLQSLAALKHGGFDQQKGITWETGRQAPGGGPAMSDEEFTRQAAVIDPQAGKDWQSFYQGQSEARLARQKLEAPMIVSAFEGVNDQESHSRARQAFASMGGDISDIPPEFDPEFGQARNNMVVQAARFAMQMENKPMSVAPGSSLVDPLTGQPIFTAPNKPRQSKLLTPEELAQQIDLKQAGRNINTVTFGGAKDPVYGVAPKDHVWARNPDGSVLLEENSQGYRTPVAVPIAGGPAARKIEDAEQAGAAGDKQKAIYADVVTQDIDRIIDLVENSRFPVSGAGSYLSVIRGTGASDTALLLDGVKANIGFDRLQQMRDASPTGGALGQVSEFENRLLQATIGSLDQAQTKEQFIFNLRRVQRIYSDIVNVGIKPGDTAKYGEPMGGGRFSKMSLEDLTSLDLEALTPRQREEVGRALERFGY
ncbi:hypothetical protein HBA54_04840 [Pelagibius litoralis]|uniref:Uncharacterized protein n=1 Tax=Pelagibius litoralis TaxID=374515 RepID=A0A967C7P8_9PROT|nr:hypothetical protein [Pelagibius litoralis]NIA67912.1 hypothetical protein [Pelagibius litoralis]